MAVKDKPGNRKLITRDQYHVYTRGSREVDRAEMAELASRGGCFGGVGDFAVLADHADEGLDGAGEAAVAAVDEAEFAPEVDAFDGEELDFAGFDVVLGKTFADDGEAGIGGDETLDHADTGEFHSDVNARAIGAEELVEHLACEAGAGKDEGLLGNFGEGDLGAMCQGVFCANHEAEAVFVDVVHFQVRRLDGESDDAHIDGAVLDTLEDLVAEIAVNADLHEGIAALEFGEDVGKKVEASGFIGAEDDGALDDVAAVGDDLDGFVAHAEELFGVLEKDDAGGSELNGLGGAVEETGFVGLFKLANLGADGGLRAEDFLARARKALQFGDEDESSKLIEVHIQNARRKL
jgi:hypothetical protein